MFSRPPASVAYVDERTLPWVVTLLDARTTESLPTGAAKVAAQAPAVNAKVSIIRDPEGACLDTVARKNSVDGQTSLLFRSLQLDGVCQACGAAVAGD